MIWSRLILGLFMIFDLLIAFVKSGSGDRVLDSESLCTVKRIEAWES